MKTILLLGGFGFLGTNILKSIDSNHSGEYEVIVFDKFEKHPAGVGFNCVKKAYAGDFSSAEILETIFEDNQIDMVLHSLSTTVPSGLQSARFDIESNLIPTVTLLDTMVRHEVRDIVYISSGGAIYGNSLDIRHKENDDVFPISSYGIVKLATEKYLMQYSELYGIQPLILRLSNPYGPWHYSMKQGVCNVAIAKAVRGETFSVWGDGNSLKDYIYVEDFTNILFMLLGRQIKNQVLNIASGQTLSVNSILKEIKKLIPDFKWENIEASRFDVSHFELDTTKLMNIIGKYDFVKEKDGLKMTYEWEKDNA